MAEQQFLASDTQLHFDPPTDTTNDPASATPQTPPARSSGPEGMRVVEQQPKSETQSNNEQPPFIQDVLAKASEGQKQAQQAQQAGDMQSAVAMEEEILQTFTQLDATQPQASDTPPTEPPHHEIIADGEVDLDTGVVREHTPEIEQVQVVSTNSPILQEEPDGKLTMQELHELKRLHTEETQSIPPANEPDRQLAQELFQALIARMDQEDVTALDSETAMYRKMEKDALVTLSTRLAEGRWNEHQDMDAVAVRLGIFGMTGMLRNLKTRAQSEPIKQKLQQVLDYLLVEYDKTNPQVG